eukprot:362147-Chlamydomonas_euryale.AAC.3
MAGGRSVKQASWLQLLLASYAEILRTNVVIMHALPSARRKRYAARVSAWCDARACTCAAKGRKGLELGGGDLRGLAGQPRAAGLLAPIIGLTSSTQPAGQQRQPTRASRSRVCALSDTIAITYQTTVAAAAAAPATPASYLSGPSGLLGVVGRALEARVLGVNLAASGGFRVLDWAKKLLRRIGGAGGSRLARKLFTFPCAAAGHHRAPHDLTKPRRGVRNGSVRGGGAAQVSAQHLKKCYVPRQ